MFSVISFRFSCFFILLFFLNSFLKILPIKPIQTSNYRSSVLSQTGQSGKEKRILPSKIPKKTKSKKNKSGLRKRRKGLLESTVPPSTLRWRLFSSAGGLSRDLISGRRIPSRNKQSKRKQEPTSPVAAGSCPSCLPDKSQAKISGGSVVARAALAAEFHAFFQQCPQLVQARPPAAWAAASCSALSFSALARSASASALARSASASAL